MRLAVVGHVEWVTFARVARLPAPGAIVHAEEVWQDAAGGGGVAAVQLSRLAGDCDFFTAVPPQLSLFLREQGITVHAAEGGLREAFVHVDAEGERTITVLGPRVVPKGDDPLYWELLAECDAVYFTGGDRAAAAHARRARVMVATPRAQDALRDVEVDVLVLSANDADELAWAEGLRARHRVLTDGANGGSWEGGRWVAAPLDPTHPVVDAYGCGDTFAAGLTFALARGEGMAAALEFAARCGAACLAGRGPYGGSLPAP